MKARYVLRDLILSRGGRLSKADIRNSRHFKGWEWPDIYRLVFELRREFRGLVTKWGQEAWEVIGDEVAGLESKLTMYEREKIAQRTHAQKVGSSELTIQQNLILKGRYKQAGLSNGVISALELSSKHLGLIIKSSTDVKRQVIHFPEKEEAPPLRPSWAMGPHSEKWYPFLVGRASIRVCLTIHRAYSQGVIDKPINQLSDEELLQVYGIGEKGLAEIREALKSQNEVIGER